MNDEETKPKKKYPPRVYRSEAEKIAIVCLRDCANLSFITITRLLGHSDSSKRNIIYVWENNKEKHICKKNEVGSVLHTTETTNEGSIS